MVALANLLMFGIMTALGFAVQLVANDVSTATFVSGCLGCMVGVAFWQHRHYSAYGIHFDEPTFDEDAGEFISPQPARSAGRWSPTFDSVIGLVLVSLGLPLAETYLSPDWSSCYAAFLIGAAAGVAAYALAHRSRYGVWFRLATPARSVANRA